MLEKIGLPPKPSLRGNNWVVDASHCQGCSSQFTFINRKHHCRRCGGIFCGSCTQNRMVLRGQGDSPVRICEPCKNLEVAARFEMRHGHKNKAGKGGSKPTNKDEDDVLHKILGVEHKQSLSSKSASSGDMLVSAELVTRSASSSSSHDTVPDFLTDGSNVTPEELRQQALEEKKKHRTLKSEGKPEEALKAFKRGKELERQAGALEIHLRKIRKKAAASSSSHISEPLDKIPSTKAKDKDDIASELKDLGWSDMDLQESDKKPVKLSVESELYSLIGEVSEKPRTTRKAGGPDRSQVIAHKKKALELKREGNLAEAKEELKKAKVLEKKIEEQELLGDDDEESDDELAVLIRSMDEDKDKHDDINQSFKLDPLVEIPNDIDLDNLDVTEDDLEDPDLAAEMISLGWEEGTTYADDSIRKSHDSVRKPAVNAEALLSEIQSLKKEALSHKRAGNNTEALTLFKKAKMLEKNLDNTTNFQGPDLVDHEPSIKPASKSRFVIQRELLDLKKKALALRREGKSDESDEMLKKGKILEQQLQEMENPSKITQTGSSRKVFDNNNTMIPDVVEDEEGEVNDQDLNDPTYLSLLKNLGWEDDHIAPISQEKNVATDSVTRASINNPPKKSKGEVQRELLGLKRKYRSLRQEGQIEEAEETLKMAKVLETQLADFDTPSPVIDVSTVVPPAREPEEAVTVNEMRTVVLPAREPEEAVTVNEMPNIDNKSSERSAPQNEVKNSLEDDIMAHKRRALALKREGNIAEAKEELKLAKMLEKQMQENNTSINTNTLSANNESSPNAAQKSLSSQNTSTLSAKNESSPNAAQKSLSNVPEKQDSSPDSGPKPLSSRDRFKLQREALNHKRQALKLRREGKTQEAEAESELAKALEAQLEESDKHDPKRASAEPVDNNVMVDDFLDPQLLSALKAIGISENPSSSRSQNSEPKSMEKSNERMQFEEQIKAEKVKALNFKKAGKQAEALDALRRAKALEKKMNSLTA